MELKGVEVSKFTDVVAAHTPKGFDLCLDSTCTEHGGRRDCDCWETNQENMTHDLGFSWQACDSCGSHLGGDRYTLSYVGPQPDCEIIELSSCQDCLMYCCNGDEPDEWEG